MTNEALLFVAVLWFVAVMMTSFVTMTTANASVA